MKHLQQCWFLAGPTASGKSETALQLASQLNAEILSLDSMAIYKQMDIGTAKPSREEQQQVPHHLIDMIEPHEEFSLAEYVTRAEEICQQIIHRGKTPLFVGGTGLYLRGLLRGVFEGPSANWEFREQLAEEARLNEDANYLHSKLQQVDPVAATTLHPNDHRRLIRALEVFHLTGEPLSQQQQQQALPKEEQPQHVFWISPPRSWLHDRINLRVEKMFAAGLVQEVQQLISATPPISNTARQGLGYKEVIEKIELGEETIKALPIIQTRTRQFAKRQHTWFRNLEECHAVESHGTETTQELVDKILCCKWN